MLNYLLVSGDGRAHVCGTAQREEFSTIDEAWESIFSLSPRFVLYLLSLRSINVTGVFFRVHEHECYARQWTTGGDA